MSFNFLYETINFDQGPGFSSIKLSFFSSTSLINKSMVDNDKMEKNCLLSTDIAQSKVWIPINRYANRYEKGGKYFQLEPYQYNWLYKGAM